MATTSARLPRVPSPLRSILEIDAAIAMVAGGMARQVRLAGLPGAERIAARSGERAREAGVQLRVERVEGGRAFVVVGPTARREVAPA